MSKLNHREIEEALAESDLSDIWQREERLQQERQGKLRDLMNSYCNSYGNKLGST